MFLQLLLDLAYLLTILSLLVCFEISAI